MCQTCAHITDWAIKPAAMPQLDASSFVWVQLSGMLAHAAVLLACRMESRPMGDSCERAGVRPLAMLASSWTTASVMPAHNIQGC